MMNKMFLYHLLILITIVLMAEEILIIPSVVGEEATSSPDGAVSQEVLSTANRTVSKEWMRTLGETDVDCGHSVQPTYDGGYILAGESYSSGNHLPDAWLIKIAPGL